MCYFEKNPAFYNISSSPWSRSILLVHILLPMPAVAAIMLATAGPVVCTTTAIARGPVTKLWDRCARV